MLALGFRGPLLGVVGQYTTGIVTEVARETSQQDRLRRDYVVRYSFSASGNQYTGSYTLQNVMDQTRLPSKGSRVSVRYVTAAPIFNTAGPELGPNLQSLFYAGAGLVALVIGVRGKLGFS